MTWPQRNLAIAAMLPSLTPECWGIIAANFFDRSDAELAMFLAQTSYESAGGYYQREVWGPTKWQRRYEGTTRAWAMGNRSKGDGYHFRGWGIIQVTWRSNTRKASQYIYGDNRLVEEPELLDDPVVGVRGAIWYWDTHGLTKPKVYTNILKATKRINGSCTEGSPSHVTKRRGLLAKALGLLG